jgi:hypothetical protein
MFNPLYFVIMITSLAGALFSVLAWRSMKKVRLLRALRYGVYALLMLSLTACCGCALIANCGYRALTREELAAVVTVTPVGDQRFTARFLFPDSTEAEFTCSGDQLYVDAHILKWHPFLNLLGVHTTYELDRVGGRYMSLENERTRPRTIYSLSRTKLLNMYHLRKRWEFLGPLLDAQYGSATFVEVDGYDARFHIRVSTSGLLVREVE